MKQVDGALKDPDLKMGLIGGFKKELVSISPNSKTVNNTFYIYENSSGALLIERGF